jgi:hypothetical protein
MISQININHWGTEWKVPIPEKMEYYDLPGAPLVRVYKNLLPSNDRILEILIDSEKNPKRYKRFGSWVPWADLGITHSPTGSNIYNIRSSDEEILLIQEIFNAYYISLSDYSAFHSIPSNIKTFPDGPGIYKYDHTKKYPTGDMFPQFNMNYHTDFVFSLKDNPGKKPITSTTMYFNDNYDGGEVVFNIEKRLSRPYYNREEQFLSDEKYVSGDVIYKPEAGDVVVFPSGNPDFLSNRGFYFHCVNRVTNGDKYFCSIFNSYEFYGSDYWKSGVEEYGEDLWNWLEKKRVWTSGFKNKAVDLKEENK